MERATLNFDGKQSAVHFSLNPIAEPMVSTATHQGPSDAIKSGLKTLLGRVFGDRAIIQEAMKAQLVEILREDGNGWRIQLLDDSGRFSVVGNISA
jgi:hypothetical protein